MQEDTEWSYFDPLTEVVFVQSVFASSNDVSNRSARPQIQVRVWSGSL